MGTVPKHSSEFGVTSTTSRVFSTASTSSCVSSTNFNVLPINFNFIMSWQEYVNTQMVGKNLKEAAIAGTDGNIWAKSTEFDIKPEEVQKLLKNFDEPSDLAATGINLGGQKYFYLSGDERVLRGKLGKGGVHVMRTKQTLLVGVYDDPMQPAQAATITES